MNKSLIYGGIGVVVVAVLAIVAFNMNKSDGPGDGYGNMMTSRMSMNDLLAKGGSQTCVFASPEGETESSGIVYLAGGKMRGDFVSKSGGQTIESHMITDGQMAHVWSNMMTQGMKIDFSAISSNEDGDRPDTGFDANEEVDYRCTNWSPDQSKFNLPSGVTFVDLNATLQAGFGAGSGTAAACAQCDAISSDATSQAQCRAALSCN